jgi:hypothetical protein
MRNHGWSATKNNNPPYYWQTVCQTASNMPYNPFEVCSTIGHTINQSSIIGGYSNGGILTPGTTYPVGGWFQWGTNNGSWLARACPIKVQVQLEPCLISISQNVNAYDNSVIPLTEKIQYPGQVTPAVPNEQTVQVFPAGSHLKMVAHYEYTSGSLTDINVFGDVTEEFEPEQDVVAISKYNPTPTNPNTWVTLEPRLWINRQDISSPVPGSNCTLQAAFDHNTPGSRHDRIASLREYQIEIQEEIGSPWSDVQLEAIRVAAQNTASAWDTLKARPLTPIRTFRKMFILGGSTPYMILMRLPSDPPNPLAGSPWAAFYSDTYSDSGTCLTSSDGVWRIICRSIISEYSIVHEFGHVLDVRTGQALYNLVDRTRQNCINPTNLEPTGNCILDSSGGTVMGNIEEDDWRRGERGWGSGPTTSITNYQQHPLGLFPDDDDLQVQVIETAADMFLNWVYASQLGRGNGFANVDWRAITNCSSGCPDSSNPGDARYNYWQAGMEAIAANQPLW